MIIVYSTQCPKCNILVKKLQAANKGFTLVEDLDMVMATAEKYGIMEAPFIETEDGVMNFSESIKALNEGRLS